MSLSRSQKVKRRKKDQLSSLREELAAQCEQSAAASESNVSLTREKEHLVVLNKRLLDQVNFEREKQRPFHQAFLTFRCQLNAEKFKELAELALQRKVLKMSKNLEKLAWLQQLACRQEGARNAGQSACSLVSAKPSMIEKDSGLEIQDKGTLREENEKFKALSESMSTEIEDLKKQLEGKEAEIEELVEELDTRENQYRTLEGHSLHLANKVTEVLDINFGLEFDIGVKESEIREMHATYQEKIKLVVEKNTFRLMREKMKWTKEARLLTTQLNEKDKEINELRAREQAARVTRKVVYQAIDLGYTEDTQRHMAKIRDLEKRLTEAEDSIKQRQANEDQLEEEIVQLHRRIESMQDMRCKQDKIIEDLNAQSASLSEEKTGLESRLAVEIDARAKDSASFSGQLVKLKVDCENLGRVNKRLENEVVSHQDRIRSRENEVKNLETQMGILDKRIEEKEILVEHLLAKKRRGFFRRLLCC